MIHIAHGLGTVAAVTEQVRSRRSPEKALPQITAKQTQTLHFSKIAYTSVSPVPRKA